MGGSLIQNATTIETQDFTGKITLYSNSTLECTAPCTITITGTDVKIENIKKVLFTIDTQSIYLDIVDTAGRVSYDIVSAQKNKVIIKTRQGTYYQTSKVLQGSSGTSITLKGTTEDIAQGTVTETYTSSFPLTEIDDLREYILSKGREQIRIGKDSDAKPKNLFIHKILYSE